MPWKGERDPYKIWLSEIILQQTRVAQGWPYYERFVARYPNVTALASAPDEEVMKLWEGLGYYSRARNLLAAARHVAFALGGKFPETYAGLLELKGVGEYTAAAIASFAYDLPHAVLDGNVYRVLARYRGIDTPIHLPEAKRVFGALANELLDARRPAAYNQAIMDFGATVCTPRNPACGQCPVQAGCVAFELGAQEDFPVKKAQAKRRVRFFYYLVLEEGPYTYMEQRLEKDVWQELWQFPLIETEAFVSPEDFLFSTLYLDWLERHSVKPISQRVAATQRQLLTHQELHITFLEISVPLGQNIVGEKYIHMLQKKVAHLTLPKAIKWYIESKMPFTLF